ILDNHSAHVSRETMTWLAAQPIGRFSFTFTPTPGSWLNLIEGFFSKLARSVLRHIRVTSKHELKERLMAFISDINREPVVHTWQYKIDDAASPYVRYFGNIILVCWRCVRNLHPSRSAQGPDLRSSKLSLRA